MLPYTGISKRRVDSGTNVNGSSSTLPANRVVGYGVQSSNSLADPVDLLSVTGAAKLKGVTSHAILAGATGDIHTEGVVPIESDGSATIAAGDNLTANVTAGANDGRVLKAIPGAGVNAFLVGKAKTAAAAVAGTIVMVELVPVGALQG